MPTNASPMKKITVLILISILISSSSFSQFRNESNDYRYRAISIQAYPSTKQNVAKEMGVQLVSQFEIKEKNNGKERKFQTLEEIYNQEGKLIMETFYHKGNITKVWMYVYNEEGKITSKTAVDKKGQELQRLICEFNSLGLTTSYSIFKKDAEQAEYALYWEYDSTKIIKTKTFKKGKLSVYALYYYDLEGNREKAQSFNSRGKLKYTWSYECSQEGERSTKHKDTTKYCIVNSQDSNGYLMRVFQAVNDKNKMTKYVSIYNQDTILIESRSYDKNDVLLHKANYQPDQPLYISYYSYKKGRLRSARLNSYDENGNRTDYKYYTYKGEKKKLATQYKYIFDDNNLYTEIQVYRDEKIVFKKKIEYFFFKDGGSI